MGFNRALDLVLETVDRRDFLRSAVAAAASAAAPGVVPGAVTGGAGGVAQAVLKNLWGNVDFLRAITHHFGDPYIVKRLGTGQCRFADLIDKRTMTDEGFRTAGSYAIRRMIGNMVGLDERKLGRSGWDDDKGEVWISSADNDEDRRLQARVQEILDSVLKTPVKKEQFLGALMSNPADLFRIYVTAASERREGHAGHSEQGYGPIDAVKGINELYGGFFRRFEQELIDSIGPKNFVKAFIDQFKSRGDASLFKGLKYWLEDLGTRHGGILDLFPKDLFKTGNERDLFRVLTRGGFVDREKAESIAKVINHKDYVAKSRDRGRKEYAKKEADKARREADELNADISRWEGEGGSVLETKIAKRLIMLF